MLTNRFAHYVVYHYFRKSKSLSFIKNSPILFLILNFITLYVLIKKYIRLWAKNFIHKAKEQALFVSYLISP